MAKMRQQKAWLKDLSTNGRSTHSFVNFRAAELIANSYESLREGKGRKIIPVDTETFISKARQVIKQVEEEVDASVDLKTVFSILYQHWVFMDSVEDEFWDTLGGGSN